MSKSLHQTLDNVEALLQDREAEAFFAEAWSEEEELVPPASEEPAGRFDGSDNAVASGHGNLPLDLEVSACRGPWQLQALASEEALQTRASKEALQPRSSFAAKRQSSLIGSFEGSKPAAEFAALWSVLVQLCKAAFRIAALQFSAFSVQLAALEA